MQFQEYVELYPRPHHFVGMPEGKSFQVECHGSQTSAQNCDLHTLHHYQNARLLFLIINTYKHVICVQSTTNHQNPRGIHVRDYNLSCS